MFILCYQKISIGRPGRPGQAAIMSVGWDTSTGKRPGGVETLLQTPAVQKFDTLCSVRLTTAQVIN